MNTWTKWTFLLGIAFYLASCDWVDREQPASVLPRYSPLQVGRFWVYEVDERVYFGENDFEDTRYYYRDQITEEFLNEQGQVAFRVIRQKSLDRQVWENEQAYGLRLAENRLIRLMDNIQEIRLVYPIQLLKEWDSNAFNTRSTEIFTIERVGSYALGERVFPAAVVVRHMEDDDLITFRDNRYEVYAENLGMVEKYSEVFSYCSRSDCLGQQIIQSGRFIHLKLMTHGIL
ncbi:MAG: hypothetical protein JJU34_05275 [Lunatimonas sp.]|uniref:hypothetical protein n=1 Tax=Lunatimonas sp. TaxID=2060141 RepID=UPI00263ADC3E|nr:hypothetical protein [Lunatimonas sp.]MCC5936672.1 hypothetical protein [Lunatimonas sp.]